MTTEHEITQALRAAYNAAIVATGSREVPDSIMRRHGGDAAPHAWRRVPESKRVACLAALEALAASGTDTAEAGIEGLRRSAFANIGTNLKERPKPPQQLDEKAIWDRFNNPPPPVERE